VATNIKAAAQQLRVNLSAMLGKRGFGAELARARKAEQESRDAAAKRILGTDVIRDKDVDAAKLLFTTLGGQVRPITLDDLRQFEHNARKLGDRFKGGITARGVVDASLEIDRQRANKQIHTAVVMSAKAGLLHFVTNAGPDSEDVRHHVHVEFPAFASFAANPQDPKRLARAMLNGALKFDCDCGRFRFWFRFIATKGRFVHGRLETGYPKIRNPGLTGVSCKHGLRVMQAVLTDPNALAQTAKMIAAAQAGNVKQPHKLTAAEAKLIAQRQLATAHHKKNQAETTAERAVRIAKTPQARARVQMAAAKEAQRLAEQARAKLRTDMDKMRDHLADVRINLQTLRLPAKMIDQMMKKAEREALKAMKG
jgi:hypothetical protein